MTPYRQLEIRREIEFLRDGWLEGNRRVDLPLAEHTARLDHAESSIDTVITELRAAIRRAGAGDNPGARHSSIS